MAELTPEDWQNKMLKLTTGLTKCQWELVSGNTAFDHDVAKATARRDKHTEYWNMKLREKQRELDMLMARVPGWPAKVDESLELRIKQYLTYQTFTQIVFHAATENKPARADGFQMMCDAVLFKMVFEPMMNGITDYHLEPFPVATKDVINYGRELVRYLGDDGNVLVQNLDAHWDKHILDVRDWLAGMALPSLYGTEHEGWRNIQPYTREEMQVWETQPYDRIRQFPTMSGLYGYNEDDAVYNKVMNRPEWREFSLSLENPETTAS